MSQRRDIFENFEKRPGTQDGVYSDDEVRLANRNAGTLLESLGHDITPTGLHYLLIHFDVPILDSQSHRLQFTDGFDNPYSLTMADIRSLPSLSMPVTLECAGNGRAGVSPRAHSMPWQYEAVGTSQWTGTLLAPLIKRAKPSASTVEIVFMAADHGFDKGIEHNYGRSLTLEQLDTLDVMLVYEMNGQPLLPQHGAPLRIIVPGWYGMASVKWLSRIRAVDSPYQGFQQVKTYRYRDTPEDPGTPVTKIKVKSLMTPPGIPDWVTRVRYVRPGLQNVSGRAWSGNGTAITRVEFDDGSGWKDAFVSKPIGQYAWAKWTIEWTATPGEYELRCRATDADGNTQPIEAPWDAAGFGNNAVQRVPVYVGDSADA